ncbi:uracil-DNA glycosylase [Lachnospiraceae bacterium NSJ-143]|nr:uracil-DNA glycosylase [Lachnospiraceae bacterium NSJ-143]
MSAEKMAVDNRKYVAVLGDDDMNNLEKLKEEYINKYSDKKLVFGEGRTDGGIMLIGEAPGGEEEKLGRPFVGKAGKNLDEFINIAGLVREDLYISNVVKFRPTSVSDKTGRLINRTPSREEIEEFVPLLMEEIKEFKPKLIVTLGNVPLKAVTGNNRLSIGDCHGQLIEKDNMRIYPLYHPASVIYNRSLKNIYAADVKEIKKYII